jgi:hypothetical protein
MRGNSVSGLFSQLTCFPRYLDLRKVYGVRITLTTPRSVLEAVF